MKRSFYEIYLKTFKRLVAVPKLALQRAKQRKNTNVKCIGIDIEKRKKQQHLKNIDEINQTQKILTMENWLENELSSEISLKYLEVKLLHILLESTMCGQQFKAKNNYSY